MKAKAAAACLLVASSVALAAGSVSALAPGTASAAAAGSVVAAAPDSTLEVRVTHLAEQLRCPVCQNQTLADSQAPLAVDLRQRIREQIAGGASEAAVIGYMTERYGDFVRYRPAVRGRTWLLWFGPFALLLVGLGGLFVRVRKQGRSELSLSPDLSTADRRRLDMLLRGSVAGERP